MDNTAGALGTSLAEKTGQAWLSALEDMAEEVGYFQPLSARHCAAFVDGSKTLIVTFETQDQIHKLSEKSHPQGFELARAEGWSILSLISDGHTWFRDPSVYRYFDRLIDDGFFEDFDRVVFFGAGSCGYAACAFSVAAPGAEVLALSPQATLDPRVAEWDDRFRRMRRVSFTDRYGYAPDMLDAAQHATILYDPVVEADAMHAALFTRPNVTKLRMRNYGAQLDTQLVRLDLLQAILTDLGTGAFTPSAFHKHHRQRRMDRTYLRTLASEMEDQGRIPLAKHVYRHAANVLNAPRFRRRLEQLEAQEAKAAAQEPPSAE